MPVPLDHTPTVAEAAQLWLHLHVALARNPKNVLQTTQRVTQYLLPYIGHRTITDVKPVNLRGYRLWLEQLRPERPLAPKTVKHLLGDARCLFNWAEAAELIEASPFPRGIMPRIPQRAPDRLEDDEVDALATLPDPYGRVVRIALGTGLRWSELCRLQPYHVRGGSLLIGQTKSGKLRSVPASLALCEEIANCSGRLVPFGIGSAGSFNEVVARRSGVARFHVHQLRHTFACRWVERGGSLAALQQILGHASVVTTQVYARLSDDAVRREAERIAGNEAATLARVSSPVAQEI